MISVILVIIDLEAFFDSRSFRIPCFRVLNIFYLLISRDLEKLDCYFYSIALVLGYKLILSFLLKSSDLQRLFLSYNKIFLFYSDSLYYLKIIYCLRILLKSLYLFYQSIILLILSFLFFYFFFKLCIKL